MASGPAETLLRLLEAQREGRILRELLHPDVVLVTDPKWPDRATCRGIEEVSSFLDRFYEEWQSHSLDWEEPVVRGERVLVRFRMELIGRTSGVEVVNEASSVYTVRDGLVARIEFYYDDAEALAALDAG